MFRGTCTLTPAEDRALDAEIKRISCMGAQWLPTKENLTEVILAIKLAGMDEHRAMQREGIRAAQSRGVKVGRPAKTPPSNFDDLVRAIDAGELTRKELAKTLGVNINTLRRWITDRKKAL